MSFLSLPFAALANLQVVIRLKHGNLDDLAFSLVPLEEPPNGSSSNTTPGQGSGSLMTVPYSMSFQAAHDDQGPILKVFASQTGVLCQTSADDRYELSKRRSSPEENIAPFLDHNSFEIADVPLDTNLLHWQFGLASDACALDKAPAMAPSTNTSFDLFNFDTCGFNDPDAFLSICGGTRELEGEPEETFALPTPPSSVAESSVTASSPAASSPPSPRPSSPFCHLVPEMMAEASDDSSERGRGRTPGGISFKRKRFSCKFPGCNRRFTSQYTLKVHTDAHRPKVRPCFPCTLGCKEQFSRQHDRLRHEVAKHGRVCEWNCKDCRRFFSSSRTLLNHKCPAAKGGAKWIDSD